MGARGSGPSLADALSCPPPFLGGWQGDDGALVVNLQSRQGGRCWARPTSLGFPESATSTSTRNIHASRAHRWRCLGHGALSPACLHNSGAPASRSRSKGRGTITRAGMRGRRLFLDRANASIVRNGRNGRQERSATPTSPCVPFCSGCRVRRGWPGRWRAREVPALAPRGWEGSKHQGPIQGHVRGKVQGGGAVPNWVGAIGTPGPGWSHGRMGGLEWPCGLAEKGRLFGCPGPIPAPLPAPPAVRRRERGRYPSWPNRPSS